MAFTGDIFIFNDIPSDSFGLTLYSFESRNTEESPSGNNVEIIEDRTQRLLFPIHYGCVQNRALEFEMTFGCDHYIDKYDVDVITSWLTEERDYKFLEIIQNDLAGVRYRCIIKDLKNIHINSCAVAFKCTVLCDSPYAYMHAKKCIFDIEEPREIHLENNGNVNQHIYPKIVLAPASGAETISVINKSDDDREFRLSGFPATENLKFEIDNETQMITCGFNINPYECFNGSFFRLRPGTNTVLVSGPCRIEFYYEILRKVGA